MLSSFFEIRNNGLQLGVCNKKYFIVKFIEGECTCVYVNVCIHITSFYKHSRTSQSHMFPRLIKNLYINLYYILMLRANHRIVSRSTVKRYFLPQINCKLLDSARLLIYKWSLLFAFKIYLLLTYYFSCLKSSIKIHIQSHFYIQHLVLQCEHGV